MHLQLINSEKKKSIFVLYIKKIEICINDEEKLVSNKDKKWVFIWINVLIMGFLILANIKFVPKEYTSLLENAGLLDLVFVYIWRIFESNYIS